MTNTQKLGYLAGAVTVSAALTLAACGDDFLEPEIPGGLTQDALASPAGIEGAVIGAYSLLTGDGGERLGTSYNYVTGSMRGGDANKGTEAGDFTAME